MVGSDVAPALDAVVRLRGVTRQQGRSFTLSPTSLTLLAGTATMVTGPNGSGKTTLLRVAAGLLHVTSGTRTVQGRSLYLLGGHGARAAQSVRSAVHTGAVLSGQPAWTVAAVVDEALAAVGLEGHGERRAGSLSSGERSRLTLAVSLACQASLVCLDEPTAHLDAAGAQVVDLAVDRLRHRGAAVLVATHDLARTGWSPDARLTLVGGRVQVADQRLQPC